MYLRMYVYYGICTIIVVVYILAFDQHFYPHLLSGPIHSNASTMMKRTSYCIIVSGSPFFFKFNYSIKQSIIMSLVISELVTSKCDK